LKCFLKNGSFNHDFADVEYEMYIAWSKLPVTPSQPEVVRLQGTLEITSTGQLKLYIFFCVTLAAHSA
jgi:hypothetical protein